MDQQTARRRFASDGAAERRSDGAARRASGRDRQRPQALEPGWLSGNPHRWIGGRRVPRQQRVVPVAGRRVLRSVDTWTVFRVSFLFYICVLLVFLIAGALLWMVASTFGVIHNVEKFIRKLFDLKSFTFQAWSILLGTTLGGMVLVLLGTGANVLAALLYNLIGDVVGGIEITVEDRSPSAPPAPLTGTPLGQDLPSAPPAPKSAVAESPVAPGDQVDQGRQPLAPPPEPAPGPPGGPETLVHTSAPLPLPSDPHPSDSGTSGAGETDRWPWWP